MGTEVSSLLQKVDELTKLKAKLGTRPLLLVNSPPSACAVRCVLTLVVNTEERAEALNEQLTEARDEKDAAHASAADATKLLAAADSLVAELKAQLAGASGAAASTASAATAAAAPTAAASTASAASHSAAASSSTASSDSAAAAVTDPKRRLDDLLQDLHPSAAASSAVPDAKSEGI
jgi:hypothetical protein